MTKSAIVDRAVALSSIDMAALNASVSSAAPATQALQPAAATVRVCRSLGRLLRGRNGAAGGGTTPDLVAADLERNGVAAMFRQLSESPARLASLGSLTRASLLAEAGAQVPSAFPAVAVPALTGQRLIAALAPFCAIATQNPATFADLAQFSTTIGALLPRISAAAARRGASGASLPPFPALPTLPAVSAEMWRPLGVGAMSLNAAAGALTVTAPGTAPRLDPNALARRLDAGAARRSAGPPPIDLSVLGQLVAALAAIDLARRHLSVDLLRPGWQAAMAAATTAAQGLSSRLAPNGAPVIPELEGATALRTTLAGMNQLERSLGFSLRAPDAAQRLGGVMQTLDSAAASPVVIAVGDLPGAADYSLARRLLRELARLYQSLTMSGPARL